LLNITIIDEIYQSLTEVSKVETLGSAYSDKIKEFLVSSLCQYIQL